MQIDYFVEFDRNCAHVYATLTPNWFERLVLRRKETILEYRTSEHGYLPLHYPSGRAIGLFEKPDWFQVREAIIAAKRSREWFLE